MTDVPQSLQGWQMRTRKLQSGHNMIDLPPESVQTSNDTSSNYGGIAYIVCPGLRDHVQLSCSLLESSKEQTCNQGAWLPCTALHRCCCTCMPDRRHLTAPCRSCNSVTPPVCVYFSTIHCELHCTAVAPVRITVQLLLTSRDMANPSLASSVLDVQGKADLQTTADPSDACS